MAKPVSDLALRIARRISDGWGDEEERRVAVEIDEELATLRKAIGELTKGAPALMIALGLRIDE